MDKIEKFASIKHILNKIENDEFKIIDLLEEVVRDIKNNELEIRIEELESKFSKDLNEHTFNEIIELKKSPLDLKIGEGIIYTGNPKILKNICPGVYGTIKPVGYCMIGKR